MLLLFWHGATEEIHAMGHQRAPKRNRVSKIPHRRNNMVFLVGCCKTCIHWLILIVDPLVSSIHSWTCSSFCCCIDFTRCHVIPFITPSRLRWYISGEQLLRCVVHSNNFLYRPLISYSATLSHTPALLWLDATGIYLSTLHLSINLFVCPSVYP